MDPRLPHNSSNMTDGSNLSYSLRNGNMTLSSQGESGLVSNYNSFTEMLNRPPSSGTTPGDFKQIAGGHSSNQMMNRAERNCEVLGGRDGGKE